MKTIPVGASAHQLVRLGAFGSFLVREADGTLTAIDTGLPGSAPGILAAARRLGAPVGRIVLTHAHQDHVGSLDALVAALGGVGSVQIAIGRREARLLTGDFSLDAAEPQTKVRGGFGRCVTRPTALMEDGQQVPGSALRAIACPGHTPGHLGFLDARDGTLFCGDALVNVGGLSVFGRLADRLPLSVLRHLAPAERLRERPPPARAGTDDPRLLPRPADLRARGGAGTGHRRGGGFRRRCPCRNL